MTTSFRTTHCPCRCCTGKTATHPITPAYKPCSCPGKFSINSELITSMRKSNIGPITKEEIYGRQNINSASRTAEIKAGLVATEPRDGRPAVIYNTELAAVMFVQSQEPLTTYLARYRSQAGKQQRSPKEERKPAVYWGGRPAPRRHIAPHEGHGRTTYTRQKYSWFYWAHRHNHSFERR